MTTTAAVNETLDFLQACLEDEDTDAAARAWYGFDQPDLERVVTGAQRLELEHLNTACVARFLFVTVH